MVETAEITDIYKAATFLCNGMILLEVRTNAGNIVSFVVQGEDLNKMDSDYSNGLMKINPLEFRTRLNQLRDLMFTEKRKAQELEKQVVCA
jgi:hypothetical protein